MGYKARAVKKRKHTWVILRARPEKPPLWWPKDASGELFWVYIKESDGSSWSTIPEPRDDYICDADAVEQIKEFFSSDYGPERDEETDEVISGGDPGLGKILYRTENA